MKEGSKSSSSGSSSSISRKGISNVSKPEGKQFKEWGVITLLLLQRGLMGDLFILQSTKGKRTLSRLLLMVIEFELTILKLQ